MDLDNRLTQNPAPGTRLVKFCGDTVDFTLNLARPQNGTAWIRTNIGQSKIIRKEIIDQVDAQRSPLGRAWFDIPMRQVGDLAFASRLPLCESGHFEAKCFFLPQGQESPDS